MTTRREYVQSNKIHVFPYSCAKDPSVYYSKHIYTEDKHIMWTGSWVYALLITACWLKVIPIVHAQDFSLVDTYFAKSSVHTLFNANYSDVFIWQASSVWMLLPDVFIMVNYRMHVIQVVDTTTEQVAMLAGKYGTASTRDAASGIDATFQYPFSISAPDIKPAPYFIVTEGGPSTCLRRIEAQAPFAVSTLICGNTSDALGDPRDVAILPNGDMFIANGLYSNILFYSQRQDVLQVYAGSPTWDVGFVDGPGLDQALFNQTVSIVYHSGLLYVSDFGNHAVRTVSTSYKDSRNVPRVVSTLIGSNTRMPGLLDGAFSSAKLCFPRALRKVHAQYMVIADSGNGAIRLLDLAQSKTYSIVASVLTSNVDGLFYNASAASIWGIHGILNPAKGEGILFFTEMDTNRIRAVCLTNYTYYTCNLPNYSMTNTWNFENGQDALWLLQQRQTSAILVAPVQEEDFTLEDEIFLYGPRNITSTTPIFFNSSTSTPLNITTPAPVGSLLLQQGRLTRVPIPTDIEWIMDANPTFVHYNVSYNNGTMTSGLYRSIQHIFDIEICCSNENIRLVPKQDPLALLPVVASSASYFATINLTSEDNALKVYLVQVDGAFILVTKEIWSLYNISINIVGNNTCNASIHVTEEGRVNILQVQDAGSVSIQARVIGFTDQTYTEVVQVQSTPVLVKSVVSRSMHLQSQSLLEQALPLPLQVQSGRQIRSIHCSQAVYEMVVIAVNFMDSEHFLHRIHTSVYGNAIQASANLIGLRHTGTSVAQSYRNASIFYGITTGSSTIIAELLPKYSAYHQVEVTSDIEQAIYLKVPAVMTDVGIDNAVLEGPKGWVANTSLDHFIYASFLVQESQVQWSTSNNNSLFVMRDWMQYYNHIEQSSILMKEFLSLRSSNPSKIDVDSNRSNALILKTNTIIPVTIEVNPRSMVGGTCVLLQSNTVSFGQQVQVQGNILLTEDGDFDLGIVENKSQPLPIINVAQNSIFVLPVYSQLTEANALLKALDVSIVWSNTTVLKALACAKGPQAPLFFVCKISSGKVRIISLDAGSSVAGKNLHVASIMLQITPHLKNNLSITEPQEIPLEGRRYFFQVSPGGNIPCASGWAMEQGTGKPFCSFQAANGLSIAWVFSQGSSDLQNRRTRLAPSWALQASILQATHLLQTKSSKTSNYVLPLWYAFKKTNKLTNRLKNIFYGKNSIMAKEVEFAMLENKWAASSSSTSSSTLSLFGFLSHRKTGRKLLQFFLNPTNIHFTAPNFAFSLAYLYSQQGGVLGDVNQDSSFDIVDVLMSQEYHFFSSPSNTTTTTTTANMTNSLGVGYSSSPIPRSALTPRHIQHLFPIGSNIPTREFLHLLYALAEKQVFLTQVNFTSSINYLHLAVQLQNTTTKSRVIFVINTWQWWMFHTRVADIDMYFDDNNGLLFLVASSSAAAAANWKQVLVATSPDNEWKALDLITSFPLSVEYKIGLHHIHNYLSEDNVPMAFVVESEMNETYPENFATYITLSNDSIAHPYAKVNLTATSVCGEAYGNFSLFMTDKPSTSTPFLPIFSESNLDIEPTVVSMNDTIWYSKDERQQGFYEAYLEGTVQLILVSKVVLSQASAHASFLSLQQMHAFARWDTWLFLPFQCLPLNSIYRLPTTHAHVSNIKALDDASYAVNISFHVGMKASDLYQTKNILLDIGISNKTAQILQRMEHGFESLFGTLWNLDASQVEIFIHHWGIRNHQLNLTASGNNNATLQQSPLFRPSQSGIMANNKYLMMDGQDSIFKSNSTFSPPPPSTSPVFSQATRQYVSTTTLTAASVFLFSASLASCMLNLYA